MHNKKGQGNVITTVFLILIAVVAVGIVGYFVFVLLHNTSINTDVYSVKLSIPGQYLSLRPLDKTVSFTVERQTGSGNISALLVYVLDSQGNSDVFRINKSLEELQSIRIENLSYSLLVNSPASVCVSPVVTGSNGAKDSVGSQSCTPINSVQNNLLLSSSQQALQSCTNNCTGNVFYVNPNNGSDSNSGTIQSPFLTIQKAVNAVASLEQANGGMLNATTRIILRGGTYYLSSPLILNESVSGSVNNPLIITNYPGETPLISGGVPITNWTSLGNNLYSVYVPNLQFNRLRVGNSMAIPARYPNYDPMNPHTSGFLSAQWCGNPWEKGAWGYSMNLQLGQQLGWNINISQSGNYTVWIKYNFEGQPVMDGKLVMRVGDNGTNVSLTNLPPTGYTNSWAPFNWSRTASMYIPSGNQTIEMAQISGGQWIFVDAFVLTQDQKWNPNYNLSSILADGTTTVQYPSTPLYLVQAESANFLTNNNTEYSEGGVANNLPVSENNNLICIKPSDIPNWSSWNGVHMTIYSGTLDYPVIADLPITSINTTTGVINISKLSSFGNGSPRAGNRFYFTNTMSALDSNNEWFYDNNTRILYYKSAVNPNSLNVVASKLNSLIVVQGNGNFAGNIYINGLNFTDTNDSTIGYANNVLGLTGWVEGSIELNHSQSVIVSNSDFENLGGYAVTLDTQSNHNFIYGNTMNNLFGGAVMLGVTSSYTYQPYDNVIEYNYISNTQESYLQGVGAIMIRSGSYNLISHNTIINSSSVGIGADSSPISPSTASNSFNNIIEYNFIKDSNLDTDDSGPIYVWAQSVAFDQGYIIRYNFLDNSGGICTKTDGEIVAPCMTNSIYMDEGFSGADVYGNIVKNSFLSALSSNSGRDISIHNNIFFNTNYSSESLMNYANWYDTLSNQSLTNNIIVTQNPYLGLGVNGYAWNSTLFSSINNNVYWTINTSASIFPAGGNWAQWKAAGYDTQSVIADPLFVDSANNNFTLQSNSPALQLGFQQIPQQKMGSTGYPNFAGPIFNQVVNKQTSVGQNIQFNVNATDYNDHFSLAGYNMPQNAQFDSNTGAFSWTPTQPGTYDLHFFAEDSNQLADYMEVDINVTGNSSYYWPLDEGSGNTAHEQTFGQNNGLVTFYSGASSHWAPGKKGSSIFFGGDGSGTLLLRNPNYQLFPANNQAFSIALWFNATNITYAGNPSVTSFLLMSAEGYLGGGFRYAIIRQPLSTSPPKLIFWSSASGGTLEVDSNQVINPGQWYFAVISYNGTGATMYLNGMADSSGTGVVRSSKVPLTVSGNLGGMPPFSGNIDELRIYNRALSASEVSSLYNSYS